MDSAPGWPPRWVDPYWPGVVQKDAINSPLATRGRNVAELREPRFVGGLKKAEILRGRGRFARVRTRGQRLDGRVLRCFFIKDPSERLLFRFGIVVPTKRLRAVRRNRLKRLIREAIIQQKELLTPALFDCGGEISIIVMYRERLGLPSKRVLFSDVRQDMGELFQVIRTML